MTMTTADIYSYRALLGDDERYGLFNWALEQNFHGHDPRQGGVDHGMREGTRMAVVCYEWDGFAKWWQMASEQVLQLGSLIDPAIVTQDSHPADIQLSLMREGGHFAAHKDAQYGDPMRKVVSFSYMLGDVSTFAGGYLRFVDGTSVLRQNDSLAVFNGLLEHEVRPVIGNRALRLTIHGYFV